MQGQTNCVGPLTARSEDGIFVFERQHFLLARLSLSYQMAVIPEENLLLRSLTRVFASAVAPWYQALRHRTMRIPLHDPLCLLNLLLQLGRLRNRSQAQNGLNRSIRRCQPMSLTTSPLKKIPLLHLRRLEGHYLRQLSVRRRLQNGKFHTIFSKTVGQKRGSSRIYSTTTIYDLTHLTHHTRPSCIAHSRPSHVSPIHLRTTSISSLIHPRTQVCLS